MYDYDLIILGSGPAGEKAGAQAAYFGYKVAIVEKEKVVGGAMVNTGTLPSKTLRETALFLDEYRHRNLYGIKLTMEKDIDMQKFMYREKEVVKNQINQVMNNIERHNIELIYGRGSIKDSHTVKIAGESGDRYITSRYIFIATGSFPHRPPDIPFDEKYIYDSDTILRMKDLPGSLIIIGGGVIGCEYASVFATLGIEIHLLDRRDRILPFVDEEICNALRTYMRKLGVNFYFREDYKKISVKEGSVEILTGSGITIRGDALLYVAGRDGASNDTGIKDLGIETTQYGHIKVNSNYQTKVPNIYAVGDVIGFPALASTSMEQGRLAACHAFNLKYKKPLTRLLPYGIYTVPEISMIGLTEKEAADMGIDYETGKAYYRENPRGQITGDSSGIIKLIFSASNQIFPSNFKIPGSQQLSGNEQLLVEQQLLGLHIIGEQAAEIVHTGLSCIYYHGTIDYFIQSVFNIPTLTDSFKYAAYDGLGRLAKRKERKVQI